MNRFGFLAENIRPLGSRKGNTLFADSLMSRNEKNSLFGSKSKTTSVAQKAHQKNVKKVAELRKKGYSMAEAWKIVKSGKKSVPKKKSVTNTRKTKTKSISTSGTSLKRKPTSSRKSTDTLTPAQKRAKRAMKLAHTKYKGDLKKAWKEIKKSKK